MKIVSDKQVHEHLIATLDRHLIVHDYHPPLLAALQAYESNPDVAPERTVRTSNTPGSDTTHLFMPCIAPNAVGVKVISGGPTNGQRGLGFQGALMILDEYTGQLVAVVNAKTLTAFRTGLASSVALAKVFDPVLPPPMLPEMSVFGAGPQAYWHVVLAGRLYPELLKRVNVISRSKATAQKLADELLLVVPQQVHAYALGEESELEQHVSNSSVVFGCTPSTEAIIRKKYINSDPGTRKFISLIGSYKLHMIELDLAFLAEYYTGKDAKVVVDSKSHTLAEAGELIQGNIGEDQLVSLVELGSVDSVTSAGGVVLLKIVGLLIMDVVMAKYVMEHTAGTETDF